MSIHVIYRACVWLPIVVPAVLVSVAKAIGLPIAESLVAEMLAYSLLWGGIPYAVLALGATWWIGGRSETEIRRLMFRAPVLMVALFVPLALGAGLMVGQLVPFTAVAVLGTLVILVLGYAYVGLAMLLREHFGPAAA